MRRTAVLIVGGGPAGSAAAITLARRGFRPELMEKTTGDHDVVCGGFLGWDALAELRRLGIDADALGARPIHRLRLVSGQQVEIALPQPAAGLSRRRLDAALLAAAQSAGTAVTRGRTVRAADPLRRRLRLDDGEEVGADSLLLATGKHDLRGLARQLGTRRAEPAVGLRTTLPPSAARERALAETVELHLFDEGYAGLLLQEDGTANLCLSVSGRRLAAAGGIEPLMAQLRGQAALLGERIGSDMPRTWQAIGRVPYGWRARQTWPGIFRVGDQGAVIASIAGDGIAVALTSGISAADAMLATGGDSAPQWQRQLYRRLSIPIRTAEVLRQAAERRGTRDALVRLIGLAPSLATAAAKLTRTGRS